MLICIFCKQRLSIAINKDTIMTENMVLIVKKWKSIKKT